MSSALQKYKRKRERAGCIGRQKQMDLYVLEANLVYIVSPKLSQGLQSETLSPNKQTNKQNTDKQNLHSLANIGHFLFKSKGTF